MSDDMSSKLQQLKDMLNNDGLSDNLQNMMGLLSQNPQQDNAQSTSSGLNNLELGTSLIKLKKIMDKRSQIDDPRINLLTAIKPYVSGKRQQHIDNCSKFLNITMLTKLFNEEDL